MKKVRAFLKFKNVIILVIFILGSFYNGYSQIHGNYGFEYAYDNAGNRISRMYLELINSKSANSAEVANDTATITDRFLNLEFSIHPNPTKGIVQIDITGNNDVANKFSLFTLQGKSVFTINEAGSSVIIDLSNQPSGVYILVCQMNDQRKEWKIIKK